MKFETQWQHNFKMSEKEKLRLKLKWGKVGDYGSSVVKCASCGLGIDMIYCLNVFCLHKH
jgi:hypothetical protein